MNVGQVYEMILAWAGKELGCYFETPVFDGATENDVIDIHEEGRAARGRQGRPV